jgi:hypothetical protein
VKNNYRNSSRLVGISKGAKGSNRA